MDQEEDHKCIRCTDTFKFSHNGIVSQISFKEVQVCQRACCRLVNCELKDPTRPVLDSVPSLQSISISKLMYYLQQNSNHHIYKPSINSPNSPIINIIISLIRLDIPEHFKMTHILSHIKYLIVEKSFMTDHDWFGQNLNFDQTIFKFKRICYVCVHPYDKLIIPFFPITNLPLTAQFPLSFSLLSSAGTDLIPLYKFFKRRLPHPSYFKQAHCSNFDK